MKKLLYSLLLLFLAPSIIYGDITGTGTYADPYTGTMTTGSFTISGIKYFNTIIVSGGTLTISAGSTLYGNSPTSGISISGSGNLNALGTAGGIITFTADNNGNGVAEAGETWKNILFDGSTGSSVIDYSLIEHGTGEDTYTLGGGILINGDNITIRNSTISNCSIGGDGGGIYLFATGSHVTLQNLKIHDNTASGNGGGLVIDGDINSVISGCEIYNNSASNGFGVYFNTAGNISKSSIHDHAGGEGVYISDVVSGASLSNCVLYNNNVGIYFFGVGNVVNCDVVNNSTGIISAIMIAPKVVNTILWGNATQYTIVSGASMVFAYCGIQGGLTDGTDGGGNKNITAANGSDSGPNFVNPASDFHLNAVVTPLVDGGISSFSGTNIPSSDFDGKARIGTLDVGAYEFVYYIWTGNTSTDWNAPSNWTGSPSTIPTSITDNKIIIPAGRPNYPTVTSLALVSRSTVTIEPRAALTVTGVTSVAAGVENSFTLKSDATGSANLITGSSVSGSINVELFLSGGGAPNYKWHYVATPINLYPKAVLTTDISNANNLLNFSENVVTTDKNTGWNWHDGYNSTTGFLVLQTVRGYNVYVPTDRTATFSGTIMAGNSSFTNSSITCTGSNADMAGWNLIGNPFTCGVNADQIVMSAKIIDKAIYFTSNNGYVYWNTFTHLGIGATNIVPPLQGFFVHATAGLGSRSVTIPASARTYSTNTLYKKSLDKKSADDTHDFPYIKFNVSDNDLLSDESIIYFFDDATSGFDTDYDAFKWLNENQAIPQIYSLSGTMSLSMNGLPLPDKVTIVPLKIRIGTAKNYTLNVMNLENLSDCKVTLYNGNDSIDLKANPKYTFSGAVGTTDMRIKFDMTILTDVNVPLKDKTTCWYSKGSVFIKTDLAGFGDNSSVTIYDVNGKIVFTRSNINLGKGETVEIPVNLDNGFYVTSIKNRVLVMSRKIVISH